MKKRYSRKILQLATFETIVCNDVLMFITNELWIFLYTLALRLRLKTVSVERVVAIGM
jgi:hypothetical protein